MKNIVILSMGQFASSDVEKLKNGFKDYLGTQGKTITAVEIWDWIKPYLPRMRLGQMTGLELRDVFNTKYEVNISGIEFKRIFNSMCEMNGDSSTAIRKFSEFLFDHAGLQVLLLSHTNQWHLEYLLEQLSKILPPGQLAVIDATMKATDATPLLFIPSMLSQKEQHPDTLQYAIETLALDPSEVHIHSFLNTVKTVAGFECEYIELSSLEKDLDKLIGVLDEVCQQSIRPRMR